MHMQELKSSNIEAAGWVGGTMRIRFHGGKTYDYQNVSSESYAYLLTAESPGRYLRQMDILKSGVLVLEKCDGKHGGLRCLDPDCFALGDFANYGEKA